MLVLRDLVKVYPGPVTALRGVRLEVQSGMFGLLGPNGAGKSTLMKIVAGLLEPTSGQVEFEGADVLADPRRIQRKLGYLPQDFGFYPHLSGRDMLVHLLRLKGVRAKGGVKRLAGLLLERVALGHAASRKVKEYSGGMRQRLGIAQAIAGDPRLIVVDEPTAGLDPEERLRFYHLLAELAQDRIVLLSTHIVEDVAVLCPAFAVIRQGELVARTTPSRARAAIEGTIYEGEVGAEALTGILEKHTVTRSTLFEGKHRVRVFAEDASPPPGFAPVAESLEDAYMILMKRGASFLTRAGDRTGAGVTSGGGVDLGATADDADTAAGDQA